MSIIKLERGKMYKGKSGGYYLCIIDGDVYRLLSLGSGRLQGSENTVSSGTYELVNDDNIFATISDIQHPAL